MTAASRALVVLVVAVAALLVAPSPVRAQNQEPMCPAEVGGLPLAVTTPFSGTVRHVAGGPSSLLCAYGEGVEPSAEVSVTWSADCGEATTAVAPSLPPQPFDQAADDLAAGLGGPCPPAEAASVPVGPLAAGGAALALASGVVLLRRRRRHRPVVASGYRPVSSTTPDRTQNDEAEPVPASGYRPVSSTTPDRTQNEEAERAAPSLEPVLALLETPRGRRFARSAAGQWAMVAAVAYGAREPATGDLARAGASASLVGRRPARPELTALAGRLAHQRTGDDR